MKKLSILFVSTMLLSSAALAADGASNSVIISSVENTGAITGIEGTVKAGLGTASVDSGGTTTIGSVTLKGSVKNTKVITTVKNKGAVTCVGNATCGSVTYDFTN